MPLFLSLYFEAVLADTHPTLLDWFQEGHEKRHSTLFAIQQIPNLYRLLLYDQASMLYHPLLCLLAIAGRIYAQVLDSFLIYLHLSFSLFLRPS